MNEPNTPPEYRAVTHVPGEDDTSVCHTDHSQLDRFEDVPCLRVGPWVLIEGGLPRDVTAIVVKEADGSETRYRFDEFYSDPYERFTYKAEDGRLLWVLQT